MRVRKIPALACLAAALLAARSPVSGQSAGAGFYQRGAVTLDWNGSRFSDGTLFNQVSVRFRFDLIDRPGQGWTLNFDVRDRLGFRGAAANQAIVYSARLTFDKSGSPFYLSLGQMNLYDTAGIGQLLGGLAGIRLGRDFLVGAYGGLESSPYVSRLDAGYLKAGAFVRWLGAKGRSVSLSLNQLAYGGRTERRYAYANVFLPVAKVIVLYGNAEYELGPNVSGENRLSRVFASARLGLGRWADLTASASSGKGLDFHRALIEASQNPSLGDPNIERFYYTGYYGVRLSLKPARTVRLSVSRQQSERKDLGVLNHTWRFGASAWDILGRGLSVVGDYAVNRGDLSESDAFYVSLTKDLGRFSLTGSLSNSFNGVRFDPAGGEPQVIHINDHRNVSLGALIRLGGGLTASVEYGGFLQSGLNEHFLFVRFVYRTH